jgi:hypothetical protein
MSSLLSVTVVLLAGRAERRTVKVLLVASPRTTAVALRTSAIVSLSVLRLAVTERPC